MPETNACQVPGVPIPPGAVMPSSRTWTSYVATPEVASEPDQLTAKEGYVSDAGRAVTAELGATVSRMMEAETTSLTLPSASRNWA